MCCCSRFYRTFYDWNEIFSLIPIRELIRCRAGYLVSIKTAIQKEKYHGRFSYRFHRFCHWHCCRSFHRWCGHHRRTCCPVYHPVGEGNVQLIFPTGEASPPPFLEALWILPPFALCRLPQTLLGLIRTRWPLLLAIIRKPWLSGSYSVRILYM